MIRRLTFSALLVAAAVPAAGQTVDDIVARNLEARGGIQRLKAVRSARMTGKMSMGGGLEADVVFEFLKPRRIRQDFTIQGVTAITAYDGVTGWQILPFDGKTDPEALADDDLKEIQEQADNLDGDLVDWREKGSRVELLGREPLEGAEAWKLRIVLKGGTEKTVWLDAGNFLEVRGVSRRKISGRDVEMVTTLGDYREAGGLRVPFSIESRPKGAAAGQTVVFKAVEFDVPIDAGRFRKPAARPAASPTPPPKP